MSLCLRFPYSIPGTVAGSVDAADLAPIGPIVPDVAEDAYEHWILKGGDSSLVGMKYGRQLTPQSGGHIWSPDYVTLPGTGNALLSDLADGGARTMMFAAMLPEPATDSGPIMAGSWGGTDPDRTGSAIWFRSTISQASVMVEGAIGQYLTRTSPAGFAPGSWVIFGLSEDLGTFPGGRQLTYVRNAGNGPPGWSTFDGAGIVAAKDVDPTKKVAIGNAYMPIFNYNPTVAAEFVIWNRYLTEDELTAAGEVIARNMGIRGLTAL